jgi:hypothetical protein
MFGFYAKRHQIAGSPITYYRGPNIFVCTIKVVMIRVRRLRLLLVAKHQKVGSQVHHSNVKLWGSEPWQKTVWGTRKPLIFDPQNHGFPHWKIHTLGGPKPWILGSKPYIHQRQNNSKNTEIFVYLHTDFGPFACRCRPRRNSRFSQKTHFFFEKNDAFSGSKSTKKWVEIRGFFTVFFLFFLKKTSPKQLKKVSFFSIPKSKKKGPFLTKTPKLFIRPPGPMRVRSVVK